MRNIFIIIFIQLIIISCNQKNEKPYQPKKDEKFSEAVNSCTKIVFLIKKENQFDYSREDSAFVAKEKYAAENKVQIQKFKNLFNNAERTAYCPDSKANYMIVFYNNQKQIDYYYVDTIKLKDKVIVFQKGYQSSQIIEKLMWNNFLKEVKLQ
jgi:hypothetical protein